MPTSQIVTDSNDVTKRIHEPAGSSSVQEDHMVDSDDDLDDTLGAIFDVSITSIVIQKD